jgi:hypothetical protein
MRHFFIFLFSYIYETMTKKASNTIFYIAVVIAVLNAIAFIVESNWTAVLFFLLATFATYSIKPSKTFALVTGIIVSNLYRATNGVHEGMASRKSMVDGDDGMDAPQASPTSKSAETKKLTPTKVKKPAVQYDEEDDYEEEDKKKEEEEAEEAEADGDLNLDTMFNSKNSLEGLMSRQTKLMKNLKDMQPMMAQAKNMLKSLPKGFVKKALEQFKQK